MSKQSKSCGFEDSGAYGELRVSFANKFFLMCENRLLFHIAIYFSNFCPLFHYRSGISDFLSLTKCLANVLFQQKPSCVHVRPSRLPAPCSNIVFIEAISRNSSCGCHQQLEKYLSEFF